MKGRPLFKAGFLILALATAMFGLSGASLARPDRSGLARTAAGIGLSGPDTASLGATVQMKLDVDALEVSLGAFQVDVTFDPAVLSFNGVVIEPHLGSTGRSVVCPPAETSGGRVRIACVSAGEADGVGATGTLAALSFGAVGLGSSTLVLEGVQLVDSGRPPSLLSVSSRNSTVTVTGPTNPPTATPVPPTATPETPTGTPPAEHNIFMPNVSRNQGERSRAESDDDVRIFLPEVGR